MKHLLPTLIGLLISAWFFIPFTQEPHALRFGDKHTCERIRKEYLSTRPRAGFDQNIIIDQNIGQPLTEETENHMLSGFPEQASSCYEVRD